MAAAECRPKPYSGIGTRMSPAEAYLAAGLLWLLACLGVARFVMTRAPVWLAFAGVGLVCLAVLGGLWYQDWRRQTALAERPLVIVTADVMLKSGNGDRAAAESIFNFCSERLAYFKAPGWIWFTDSLPTTGTQKIQKHAIFPSTADPRTLQGMIDLQLMGAIPLVQSQK